MLLPEQVVQFLDHDDPMVRDHALHYFNDTHDFGPLTADHYWAVIDRRGENDATRGFACRLENLPQTDASLRRLVQAINTTQSDDFDYDYQRAARDMDMSVLARNRDELLACPKLLPHVREHLQLRLSLLDQPAQDAWDRLMQHGLELGNGDSGSFNPNLSDALIEAAARGGIPICQRAMNILADESCEDWREIFAVKVLGRARYEPAVDALIAKLAIDADVLREEVNRALTRIATPRVVERIVDFYPGKPWHVRLYAYSSLANIKRPESEDAMMKLLDIELALAADPNYDDEGAPLVDMILVDLTRLCSLAGLEQSRRLIGDSPDDVELLYLCESLIATSVMNGVTLPEETTWRALIKAREDRRLALGQIKSADDMLREMHQRWMATGNSFAPEDAAAGEHDDEDWNALPPSEIYPPFHPDRMVPIRNAAPKIGRNDPCPCGSGKKYKKCCLNRSSNAVRSKSEAG
ncbi:MAG: SEC-C metal-binding domain-containing protein [Tepidisphaeraceae bacterium]|jgi:hypothetical protein